MGSGEFVGIVIVIVVIYILYRRAKEVRQEVIEEALEEGDKEKAEDIENMSDDEIIDNYDNRF